MEDFGVRSVGWFDQEFGIVSASERRQADLFFGSLVGARPLRRRAPFPGPALDTSTSNANAGPAWEETDSDWDDLAETTFTPEDLSKDMAGLEFVMVSDADIKTSGGTARHTKGTVVTVVKWDNAKTEIEAKIGGSTATIAKELLSPNATVVKSTVTTPKGSRQVEIPLYVTDAKALRAAIVKGKAASADQTANYKQLNKHLIIEMMLNRQDRELGRWTVHYDAMIGEPAGWVTLAAGWVKSMMVQESTAGTAGLHLVETSGNPLKTRFNVLQAIDSWGPQQFLMMQEIEPGFLKKKGLDKVMDDQRALEKEWQALFAKTTRTTAENERLRHIDTLKFVDPSARRGATWSPFFFKYPDVKPKSSSSAAPTTTGTDTSATGAGGTVSKPNKYWDAVVEFLEGGKPKRKYDYSFWIQTGVRWLFEKRKDVSTWSDAVRAYNGTGGRAEFYRAIVLTRARAAAAAAGIKEETWGGFDCPTSAKTKDGLFQLCGFERIANPCEPRC